MAIQQASDLLTVREAAAHLKVSPLTIGRYLKQGRLRAYRVGPRAIRVRRADVESLLTPATGERMPLPTDWHSSAPPSAEELVRRRAVVEQVLARRQERVITPLTTAELVHRARAEDTWYDSGR